MRAALFSAKCFTMNHLNMVNSFGVYQYIDTIYMHMVNEEHLVLIDSLGKKSTKVLLPWLYVAECQHECRVK